MNERILKLADKAIEDMPSGPWNVPDEFCKKFAELIVRECAKEAFKYTWNEENYQHYNDIGWDCLPGDLQSHIQEQFGVEE